MLIVPPTVCVCADIVTLTGAVATPPELVARMVKLYDPLALGTPLRVPFEASVRPGGIVPDGTSQLIGVLPVAVNV